MTTKPPVKGTARKGKRKGKKEVFDAEEANAQRQAAVSAEKEASNWGPLEPLHALLAPLISLLNPFMNAHVLIAVLAALLLYSWLAPPSRRGGLGVAFPGFASPERVAAYEEIWRREESSLWDWLEDRVGLDGVLAPAAGGEGRQRALAARHLGKKVGMDGSMSERQVDHAIRVTEERLKVLKEAVERRKGKGAGKG